MAKKNKMVKKKNMNYNIDSQEIIMDKELEKPVEIKDKPAHHDNNEYKIITKNLDVFYGEFQALKKISM
jgi:hypothetical protein